MASFQLLRTQLLACLLAFSFAAPLAAQLKPAWQSPNSPDFLDLYQRSSSTKVKPEIVTVFDFSGSMAVMMFHKDYVNADTGDNANGDCYFQFTLTWDSANSKYLCRGDLIRATGTPYGTPLTGDLIGSIPGGADSNLVRPDGSLVTAAAVDGTATTYGDFKDGSGRRSGHVTNWIMACSHIRITYNGREVDLPVPWKIMNSASTGYPLSSYTHPDPVVTVTNPDLSTRTYGSGTNIEMDRSYRASLGTVISNVQSTGSGTARYYYSARIINIADYRQDYLSWIFNAKSAYPSTILTTASGKAFANGIPARTRVQAVKEAAVKTWVAYQDKVIWAFRFLNPGQSSSVYGENGANTNTTAPNSINRDSRNPISTSDNSWIKDPLTTYVTGRSRVWTLLNNTTANPNNSVNGMNVIASLFGDSNTPLTYALANTLAQFSDPNSVFNDYYNSTGNTVYDCGNHCVILFTDGQPNTEGSNNNDTKVTSPYINATTLIGNANDGNVGLGGSSNPLAATKSTSIDRDASNWNITNFAAVAAHGVYPASKPTPNLTKYWAAPSSYPASGAPSEYIPFAVTQRNGTTFKSPHPIQVMTVGVSLGGNYTSTSGGKRRLFQAAAFGDPNMTSWNLNNLKPFEQEDPTDPDSPKKADSVYFFDASSPELLVTALAQAFKAAAATKQTASTSVPVIPWIGSGLSHQIYLAAFTVPQGGGPVWSGDLMMFPTKEVTSTDSVTGSTTQTLILDNTGNQITGDLMTVSNPGWSASKALTDKGWKARKIYTRLESTSVDYNPVIFSIPTTITTTDFGSGKPLANLVPGSTAATKLLNLQWMMGADVADVTKTRGDIFGDVLDSAPSFLEYSITDANKSLLPSTLLAAWDAAPAASRHFRVLYVGTNQGVVHALGEVTWDKTIGSGSTAQTIKAGIVDELWAFIPTDIIKYCDHYLKTGDPHYFGVNGSPYLYFLDLPASGKRSGNGMMDIGSTTERATLIMGLGKGGRSYYAIDVRNPFSPKLGGTGNNGWALVPDEPTSYPDGIFETTIKNKELISKMGWSTCQPTVARLLTGSGTSQIIRDILFLGGGFSVPEIEKNYPTADANTKLGRSIIALDIVTGKVVAYWDLSGDSTIGPIGAGVMPMQVVPYSGLTQRAYFTDYFGGLWALGSTANDPRPEFSGFRVDSSNLGDWAATPRPVYRQDRPEGITTTMPAPFLVSNFYPRSTTPFVAPLTVGVALVSGDRNNPMDKLYTGVAGNTKPSQHRLNVVFDRQDSAALGLDTQGISATQLKNMSDQTDPFSSSIQPGSTDFYLNNSYGYYLNFPARIGTAEFVSKGLITPIVLSGKLFYSYFSPLGYEDGNPCNNGTGSTSTVQVCNVMTPTFPGTGETWDDTKKVQGCASGEVFTWLGLASRFSPKSVLAVLQAGLLSTGSGSTASAPELKIKSFDGTLSKALAGPKVWRTVR